MKIGIAVCGSPACRTITEAVVEDDGVPYIKCSVCGQSNEAREFRQISDGVCHRCNQSLDDHQWVGDQAICHRKGK